MGGAVAVEAKGDRRPLAGGARPIGSHAMHGIFEIEKAVRRRQGSQALHVEIDDVVRAHLVVRVSHIELRPLVAKEVEPVRRKPVGTREHVGSAFDEPQELTG